MTYPVVLDNVIKQNSTYAKKIIETLAQNKFTLSIAESITGGLLSSTFTDIPGSSKVFLDGVVTYSIDAKVDRLHISRTDINTYGVISTETAKKMALSVRKSLHTTYSIGITGNAGPTVDQIGTKVGIFHIAICHPEEQIECISHSVSSDYTRIEIKHLAVHKTLVFFLTNILNIQLDK